MNFIHISYALVVSTSFTLFGVTYIEGEFNDVITYFMKMSKKSFHIGCLVGSLAYMQYVLCTTNVGQYNKKY